MKTRPITISAKHAGVKVPAGPPRDDSVSLAAGYP